MKVLLLLAFVACSAASVEQNDEPIQVQVEQKFVHLDVLKARQAQRLAKLGKSARTLPKYHPKLLDVPYKNDYITGDVKIGTQGPFSVALSAGQTRLWVLGKKVKNVQDGHTVYDPAQSDTAKNLNKDFAVLDGSLSVAGSWYSDIMQYGKAKIKGQPFGVAANIDVTDDQPVPIDGVLGINHLASYAYSSSGGGEPTAPIDSLLKPLIKKTVTIFLDKLAPPKKGSAPGGAGTVTIGGFDKVNCDGSSSTSVSLTYQTDYLYVAQMSQLQYGDFIQSEYGYAYFDNGVSTLQLPDYDLSAIYNIILPDYDWDTGMYTVPCDSVSSLSTLYLNVYGVNLQIDPQNFVVDLGLDGSNCALALGVVDKTNYANEVFVFGTPLFRSYCIGFDFDNYQLNFYNHLH